MQWALAAALSFGAINAAPANAAPPPPALPLSAASAMAKVLGQESRLQTLGFRLVTANAPYCADQSRAIGLLALDARNFTLPQTPRTGLGLRRDFAVAGVAAGSPTAAAGIVAGEEIEGVDGLDPNLLPAAPSADTQRQARVNALIAAALAERGRVTLTLRARTVTLIGVPACRSGFETLYGASGGQSDGTTVRIAARLLDEAASGDEAAFVVAHELAHTILRHPARLAATGRSSSKVRETEREADRLAVWLMANAGYDPRAAATFLRRWGTGNALRALPVPDHDSWKTRVRLVEAERLWLSGTTPHDWRARFTPYSAPANTAL